MSELVTPYGNVTEISGHRGTGRTTTLMQHLGEKDFMFSPFNRTYFGNDKRFHHYGELLDTQHFFRGRRGFKVFIDDLDWFNNFELRRALSPIEQFKPDSDVWTRLEELRRTSPLMAFYLVMMELGKCDSWTWRVDGYTIVSDGELQTRNIEITPDDFENVMGLSRKLSALRKEYVIHQRIIEVYKKRLDALLPENVVALYMAKANDLRYQQIQKEIDQGSGSGVIQGKSGGQVIVDEFSL